MDASSSAPASYDLSEYAVLLRKRWRLVAAGVLAGILLPGLYLLFGPKAYTGETEVLVEPLGIQSSANLANGISPTEVNLDTEAQIATSMSVAKRAKEMLGTDIPPQQLIEDHVEVTVPPNSSVLTIAYDAPDPETARAGAQAFAKAYLTHRRKQAREDVQQQIKALEAKIRRLTVQLDRVRDGAGPAAAATAQETVLTEQIATLSAQLSTLNTGAINPGYIFSASPMPTTPSSPIIPLWLASGVMAGLLLGLTAAVVRDRGDTRIRDASDVERLVKLPVLVDMPGRRRHSNPPSLLPPRSRPGQAFHELSHSLTATLGHGNHVVLVTGASPGAGTGVVATNLAATLARTGSGTVLVCADMQSTTSAKVLGLESYPGLSDILLHGTRISAVEQRPIEPSRLRVVAPGLDAEAASEQLQTHAMERFVGELRQSATFIVVEAPSTSESADAQGLADLSDVALLVVEAPRAERDQVREGVRRLDRVGAATLGAVLVPTFDDPETSPPPEQDPGQPSARPSRQRKTKEPIGTRTAPLRLPPEDLGTAKRVDDPAQSYPSGQAPAEPSRWTHATDATRAPGSTRTP